MTTANAALATLDAHKKVVDQEREQMKDDIALLRDLRRRYGLPLSELPPCRGLPAPVAASARKFLVDTEAYIMRKMSANQSQSAEITNQAEQLRGTINQTASIAHAIAGTTPTTYAYAPGSHVPQGNLGVSALASANAANFGGGGGGGGGGGSGGDGSSMIQTPHIPPQISFQGPLPATSPYPDARGSSPGGASRYTSRTTAPSHTSGGMMMGGGGGTNFASPVPNIPVHGQPEIRFEAPMGMAPYLAASNAAYRQQQALAYLAADQGVLPRGWNPAPAGAGPLVPPGMNSVTGAVSTSVLGGGGGGGSNVSPSRRMAIEMSGEHGGTTFVVLPRASSQEPKRRKNR